MRENENQVYIKFRDCYRTCQPDKITKLGDDFLSEFENNMTSRAYAECCRLVMLGHLMKQDYAVADIWRSRSIAMSYLSGNANVLAAMFISYAIRADSLNCPTSGIEVLRCMEQFLSHCTLEKNGYPSSQLIFRMLHEKRGYLFCKIALSSGQPEDFNRSLAEYDAANGYVEGDLRGQIKVELGRSLAEYFQQKKSIGDDRTNILGIHDRWIKTMEQDENIMFKTLYDKAKKIRQQIADDTDVAEFEFYETR